MQQSSMQQSSVRPQAQPAQAQPLLIKIPAQPITSEQFRPYGQLIRATADDKGFDAQDAQLQLSQGIPRFYIMRLEYRGRRFDQMTRHRRCTQCLGSINGADWLLAVAPPSEADRPALETIAAFRIPGDCFVKLELATWHAGPYFDPAQLDFYSLELSDTNLIDHQSANFQLGVVLEIV